MGSTVDDDDKDSFGLRCEWEPGGFLVLAGEAVNDLTPQESRQLELYLRAFVRGRVEEIRARRVEQLAALR
ncbi:MAG TPA: hypothetical protein VFP72_19950 [Kineosporiaceae bacterium]|nr:hypothetical protein [Kineosporiaceae bacterium]